MPTPEQRDKYLRAKYGLTLEQHDKMLALQGGCCAICRKPPKKQALHVEHDHKTGRVRGLACFPCNTRIGRDRTAEHAELHRRIAEYITSDFDGRQL